MMRESFKICVLNTCKKKALCDVALYGDVLFFHYVAVDGRLYKKLDAEAYSLLSLLAVLQRKLYFWILQIDNSCMTPVYLIGCAQITVQVSKDGATSELYESYVEVFQKCLDRSVTDFGLADVFLR